MRNILRRKWHGVSIGILAAVLTLVLTTGVALAAFVVFAGNANVTVVESITVTNTTGDSGEAFTGQEGNYAWNVSLYPGQTKILNVLVTNVSPINVSVGTTGTGNEGIAAAWSGDSSVNGNSSITLTLTVTAATDAYPGSRTIYFDISR